MLYLANDSFNAVLSASYTVGDTTLYVDAVPDNTPTIIVIDYGGTNETIFWVTGKTSNTLTGVKRIKGANTNIDSGTAITCLNNEEFINQFQSVGVDAWADVADGSTISCNLSLSKKQRVTITDTNARTIAISGDTPGMAFIISLKYGGANAITWFDTIYWVDGTEPTPTGVLNMIDVFGFIQVGTNQYLGFVVGQNMS